jgi:hypothetical protein
MKVPLMRDDCDEPVPRLARSNTSQQCPHRSMGRFPESQFLALPLSRAQSQAKDRE